MMVASIKDNRDTHLCAHATQACLYLLFDYVVCVYLVKGAAGVGHTV